MRRVEIAKILRNESDFLAKYFLSNPSEIFNFNSIMGQHNFNFLHGAALSWSQFIFSKLSSSWKTCSFSSTWTAVSNLSSEFPTKDLQINTPLLSKWSVNGKEWSVEVHETFLSLRFFGLTLQCRWLVSV